jgi:hypothetical protein
MTAADEFLNAGWSFFQVRTAQPPSSYRRYAGGAVAFSREVPVNAA